MARKVGVTRGDVVAAAAAIADREGLEELTLAKVADVLGVRSPSLYAHVDGIAGLRRELQIHASDVLATAFEDAIGEETAGQPLAEVAHAYRRFAHDHPGLLDALFPAPRPGEDEEVYQALAETAAVVAEAVIASGVAPEHAVDAVRSLRSAVHGFVVLEKEGGFGMPADIDGSFAVLVRMLVRGIGAMSSEST